MDAEGNIYKGLIKKNHPAKKLPGDITINQELENLILQ